MSILDETHAPMDFFYHLSAEMMPKGFREKFDLEISHRALEYVALPHLALANITLSLAANGKALLQWSYSQFERMYPHVSASGISGYYNKYLREIISGTKARAQRNGRLVEGELLLKGSISEKQWMIRRALEFSDLDSKQALAYCAELSLINAMPGFRVAIDKYEKTQFGALPVIVTIDRV